ncbi:MAG: hypothetical protein DSZ03_03135 [Sulfurimonas sp.]|nr:MAG: hypothetical protein DSZ03_03135 [Sulfurimonas sp.]
MILLRRMVKEPLVHFLAAALLIYWVQNSMHPSVVEQKRIALSAEELTRLKATWRIDLQRELSDIELRVLKNQQLQDNVLFEEALHLGLHREDRTIYETLVQRIKQQLQASATLSNNLDTQTLYRYYQEHQDNYRQQADISFDHVFLSIEHEHPFKLAQSILRVLQEGNVSCGDLSFFGDATDSNQINTATRQHIKAVFGDSFYTQISRFNIGLWGGPVISNSGIHLIRVTAKHGGKVLPYDAIKDIVVSDYLEDVKRRRYKKKLRQIRAKYSVVTEPK